MIHIVQGSIFNSKAEALTVPVNCIGVAGAGLAKQFKLRYPDWFRSYKSLCSRGFMVIGGIQTHHLNDGRLIINFPTKFHWNDKSWIEGISSGLAALTEYAKGCGLKSIAIPALGCGLGGLHWEEVRPLIEQAFESLPDIEVSLYPPDQMTIPNI
jgi:O-acetyl-ADP-ribose deacetylase (regulator of RNase III)